MLLKLTLDHILDNAVYSSGYVSIMVSISGRIICVYNFDMLTPCITTHT